MILIDTRYGPIQAPDWPDDLIVRALVKHGEWAECETQILSSLINPGENFWDIGAFLGTFGLSVSRHVPLGKIVAVEANPELSSMITANLRQNLLCEFAVADCGVAEIPGWIVPMSQDLEGNQGAMQWGRGSAEGKGAVRCQTLAQLRATHGNYDVLKLDIEGMEIDALKSDWPYIKERRPLIWVECNEDIRSIELLGMLWWMGYQVHYFAFPAFSEQNFLKSPDLIYPNVYEAALVAIPEARVDRLPAAVSLSNLIYRPITNTFELRSALFDTPRWSTPEWNKKSHAELIALLCRTASKETLANFLVYPTSI